jgi:hypothetical protein
MTYKATYIRNAGTYLAVGSNGAVTQIKSLLDDSEHPTSYVVSETRRQKSLFVYSAHFNTVKHAHCTWGRHMHRIEARIQVEALVAQFPNHSANPCPLCG